MQRCRKPIVESKPIVAEDCRAAIKTLDRACMDLDSDFRQLKKRLADYRGDDEEYLLEMHRMLEHDWDLKSELEGVIGIYKGILDNR